MGWLHAKGLTYRRAPRTSRCPAGWTAADEPDAAKAVRFRLYPARKARHGRSRPMVRRRVLAPPLAHEDRPRTRRRRRVHPQRAGIALRRQRLFFGYQRNPLPSVPRVVRDILANGKLDVRIGVACERRGDIP